MRIQLSWDINLATSPDLAGFLESVLPKDYTGIEIVVNADGAYINSFILNTEEYIGESEYLKGSQMAKLWETIKANEYVVEFLKALTAEFGQNPDDYCILDYKVR